MKNFRFNKILTAEGWLSDQLITCDEEGIIRSIRPYSSAGPGESAPEMTGGILLPGITNAHSHAFQYAMAGRGEFHRRGGVADDFWSWREQMYSLALTVTADELETIASVLYLELLRNGYTRVVEFHYLHHQPDGTPYADPAEHGRRLIRAAARVGIRITLVPVFYAQGGFGKPPEARQRRFISPDVSSYFRLLERTIRATQEYEYANAGFGVHSLRAATAGQLREIVTGGPSLPFHLHISEQAREVKEAVDHCGARPVEWLEGEVGLHANMHLVHATHINRKECQAIARSGARVILCPSTEGNLGDGLFPLADFVRNNGRWSIGTDSHVGLNPMEELRWLDYGQRTSTHYRNTVSEGGEGDSGLYLLKQAISNGNEAGNSSSFLRVGEPLDGWVADHHRPELACCPDEHLASVLVYHSRPDMFTGTLVGGEWVVREGHGRDEDAIRQEYLRMMRNRGVE